MQTWRQQLKKLQQETYAIYIACKDPRVPWYARLLAGVVVAYAFSPIDLIPDVIPVIGYLDDLILVPLGIALVIKMIPPQVLQDCREKAATAMAEGKPTNWTAAIIVVVLWFVLGIATVFWLKSIFG
ncbi:YkvA family protein [Aliterella atlantica]|uniref:Membrane protein n=1 Tax=Aliterella atlantica CENA595 TaxID=1618023 RepID=A0A0D9A2D0_9CYAN|nr:YkvA family protein [Aliterella atlantica]KJH73641.1 membrane protein [Aliterella atlantica CENA595]